MTLQYPETEFQAARNRPPSLVLPLHLIRLGNRGLALLQVFCQLRTHQVHPSHVVLAHHLLPEDADTQRVLHRQVERECFVPRGRERLVLNLRRLLLGVRVVRAHNTTRHAAQLQLAERVHRTLADEVRRADELHLHRDRARRSLLHRRLQGCRVAGRRLRGRRRRRRLRARRGRLAAQVRLRRRRRRRHLRGRRAGGAAAHLCRRSTGGAAADLRLLGAAFGFARRRLAVDDGHLLLLLLADVVAGGRLAGADLLRLLRHHSGFAEVRAAELVLHLAAGPVGEHDVLRRRVVLRAGSRRVEEHGEGADVLGQEGDDEVLVDVALARDAEDEQLRVLLRVELEKTEAVALLRSERLDDLDTILLHRDNVEVHVGVGGVRRRARLDATRVALVKAEPHLRLLLNVQLHADARHGGRPRALHADRVPRLVRVARRQRAEPLGGIGPLHVEQPVALGVAHLLLKGRRPRLVVSRVLALPQSVCGVSPRVAQENHPLPRLRLHRTEHRVGMLADQLLRPVLLPHLLVLLRLLRLLHVHQVLSRRTEHLHDAVVEVAQHRRPQVLRHRRRLVRHARQVGQRGGALSRLHREVRAVELRVRLLHKRHPQLVGLVAVAREGRLRAAARQEVVDHDVLPPLPLAHLQAVDAQLRVLLAREDATHVLLLLRERAERAHEVAVRERTLVDVRRLNLVYEQLRLQTGVLEQLPLRRPLEREHLHLALLPRCLHRAVEGQEVRVDEQHAFLLAQLGDLGGGGRGLHAGRLHDLLHLLQLACVRVLGGTRLLLQPRLVTRPRRDALRVSLPLSLHERLGLLRVHAHDPLFTLDPRNAKSLRGGSLEPVLANKLLVNRRVCERQLLRSIIVHGGVKGKSLLQLRIRGRHCSQPRAAGQEYFLATCAVVG
eukprot:Rhum_TRINITY_DN14440_c14_g1::Rhum_TRINITY_DN14440_c14_g1_i1::g.90681::m.90681